MQFKCRFCNQQYTTRHLLQNHEASHEGKWKHTCLTCGKGFNSSGALIVSIYSRAWDLRSLVWTATCLVRQLYEVNLLCNSLDLMFILPLLFKVTCLLRPIFVAIFSGHSKQVLLYRIFSNMVYALIVVSEPF